MGVGSTAAWAERLLCDHPPFGNWQAISSSMHSLLALRAVCIGGVVRKDLGIVKEVAGKVVVNIRKVSDQTRDQSGR